MAVDFETLTDEDYFGHMKMMFQTPGWKILMRELYDNAVIINNLQDVKDERDLDYKRGQLAAMGQLINFEDTIGRAEKEQAEQQTPDTEAT